MEKQHMPTPEEVNVHDDKLTQLIGVPLHDYVNVPNGRSSREMFAALIAAVRVVRVMAENVDGLARVNGISEEVLEGIKSHVDVHVAEIRANQAKRAAAQ